MTLCGGKKHASIFTSAGDTQDASGCLRCLVMMDKSYGSPVGRGETLVKWITRSLSYQPLQDFSHDKRMVAIHSYWVWETSQNMSAYTYIYIYIYPTRSMKKCIYATIRHKGHYPLGYFVSSFWRWFRAKTEEMCLCWSTGVTKSLNKTHEQMWHVYS